MNKKTIICAVLTSLFFAGCFQKQTLTVIPNEQNSSKGVLKLFENSRERLSVDVLLGKNGVAPLGQKREGDGKTPSGTYEISSLFGKEAIDSNMPFIKTTKKVRCVDDTKSPLYNKIINSQTSNEGYDSFEEMLRDDGQYDIGAVIDYNKEAQAAKGSCIFIHIQKDASSPTAGCVAMKREDAYRLLKLLDKSKAPSIEILSK